MQVVCTEWGQRPGRCMDIKLAVVLIQTSLFSSGNQPCLGTVGLQTLRASRDFTHQFSLSISPRIWERYRIRCYDLASWKGLLFVTTNTRNYEDALVKPSNTTPALKRTVSFVTLRHLNFQSFQLTKCMFSQLLEGHCVLHMGCWQSTNGNHLETTKILQPLLCLPNVKRKKRKAILTLT